MKAVPVGVAVPKAFVYARFSISTESQSVLTYTSIRAFRIDTSTFAIVDSFTLVDINTSLVIVVPFIAIVTSRNIILARLAVLPPCCSICVTTFLL